MATTPTTDAPMIVADTTTVAASSTVDKDARAWVTRIESDFWQLDTSSKTRTQWANDHKYNPLALYQGAITQLQAVAIDLGNFHDFLDANGITSGYYVKMYEAYMKQLEFYRMVAKTPPLTQAEIDKEFFVGVCDKVDDGDTIFVNGKEIRLVGINAAEKGDNFGVAATEFIKSLILNQVVTVYFDKNIPFELYLRVLGTVYLGDGTNEKLYARPDADSINVNLLMVKNCYAAPDTKFGRNNYMNADKIKAAAANCSNGVSGLITLHVTSKDTHARVYLDGKDLGMITPADVVAAPGMHHLVLVASGDSALHEDIEFKYGMVGIHRDLLKLPVAAGLVNIFTTPDDCDILIDDAPQGVAPLIGIQLLASKPSKITLVHAGYKSKDITITPLAGRVMDITDSLEVI
jgi:endonuclease YncB( thermonuclease family)